MVVDLVEVGGGAELAPQVDRRQGLDGDLGRQREVAGHVADVDHPRQGDRDRQDFQPEQLVEPEALGEPLAAGEEERGLLAADRDDGDDRYARVEREPEEALAPAEVDAATLPRRAVDLVVAAGVHEHGGAGAQRLAGVLVRGGDGAVLAQERQPGHREHEVVGELVEGALDPEVGAEREREDAGVRGQVAARVVAHEQHRALLGHVAEPAHLGAEVQRGEQPQPREALPDVVGVALVEVGRGDAGPDELRDALDEVSGGRHGIGESTRGYADGMSVGVLALVLAAAFAHAAWNFLAKGARGGAAFVWLSMVIATVAYLPVVGGALAVDPGELGWTALGLMVGSGLLHTLYFTLLQRGYAAGDLSIVYPLARGTGPLLSGAAAIALLGERPSALALAGGLIIVAAVFSLVGR